jgi:hypothetical protein
MKDWSPEAENSPVESIVIFGVRVKLGDSVRIWPQKSADIMDLALKGKVAVIEAIERDFDDQIHIAVVVEDDPGHDLGMLRQPGHRFFFFPEELEPLTLKSECRVNSEILVAACRSTSPWLILESAATISRMH